jgi:hypothetical protein
MQNIETDPALVQALKDAAQREMTPREKWLQRVSWVYGNLAIENPLITREMVERQAIETYGPCPD